MINLNNNKKMQNKDFNTQVGGNHYSSMAIEPIEFIVANKLDFIQGNCIKYACRHKNKGKDQDIKKIIQYAVFSLKHDYGYSDSEISSFMLEHFGNKI